MNAILDQLAVEGAETMVKKMIEAADGGDRVAARLVLSRIWSAPKGRAVAIELPEIHTPADLLDAHAAVVKAIADQTITPQDGASLSSVLETHRRTPSSSWWRRRRRLRRWRPTCGGSRAS